ncbi:LptE family protein [uncultured Draconibacterium sp.]|uniref:LptE family protein n=1 Tax=uncultured Draconibacterium sp. TaxID=1573823 RepID=UPI0029C87CF3|nr:LptE family protein [uncultured Draconibacterium sp.]
MLKRNLLLITVVILLAGFVSSCSVKYNFTGSKPMILEKTFTVYYFPNRARLINPTLSQSFTEELREKLTRQTSLNELSESGDLEFEGQITGYEFRPMSIQKQDESAQTRLTITINVKYTNNQVPEESFEKSFSAYEDFDSNLSISSVEEELSAEIIEKLTDDIFNATIANW